MKINQHDLIEEVYLAVMSRSRQMATYLIPYFRRILRFVALPYCYFALIDWEECPLSRYQVIKDLLYIFFRLKYFPENYSLCRLWEKNRGEWRYYYGSIYDAYQRGRLRREVQKKDFEILFEDKNICYQLCKAASLPLPIQYACLDKEDNYHSLIGEILKDNPGRRLVIKPVMGKGGKGIALAFTNNQDYFIRLGDEVIPLKKFKLTSRVVVQEYLTQHPILAKMAPSTNTVRIATLLSRKKEVIVIGALMRFGVGDAYVDNWSSGGVAVGIDLASGTLLRTAYDVRSRRYLVHPTSGLSFEDFRIPLWNDVVELTRKVQLEFLYYRMLGLDIAITDGGPIIIEINAAHDNVLLEQTYGPILANMATLEEFKNYCLLINRLSSNL